MSQDAIYYHIMEVKIRSKEIVQVEFREVSQTGVFIAHTEANHKNSMSLLQQNNLRPLTYWEAILKLSKSRELKEQLENTSFYLDAKGSPIPPFNNKGELIRQGDGNIPKILRIWKVWEDSILPEIEHGIVGHGPGGWRFGLYAVLSSNVEQVVVGVREHEVVISGTEASKRPRITAELIDNFRSAVSKVEGVFKEVLRAIE